MQIQYYLYLSFILFGIGALGVMIRRNAIIVFMCIEMMLNSVNLLLVAFSKVQYALNAQGIDGQIFVFFVMVVAAAEVTVGLAIIVMCYRNTRSIDIGLMNRIKN
ncbi:MAG: NADH-quinone oxidoreductase subunit NuoK [Phycisphaerales bacterium]|nr:NADH-quinone oxidoreductase subunit NuoK [Phycisphaerales bacterium]